MKPSLLIQVCAATILLVCAGTTAQAQLSIRGFAAADRAANDQLGCSVAATPTWTVAGACRDANARGTAAGAVYVFNATTGAQARKLMAPDGAANDHFGYSVATSGDYLLVGAPDHAPGGSVYVFRLSTGSFVRKLGEGLASPGDQFGFALAVWGDLVAIGSPGASAASGTLSQAGKAYVLSLSTDATLASFEAADASSNANLGYSVAIDNFVLAASAPNESRLPLSMAGSVYVAAFNRSDLSLGLTTLGKIFPADAASLDGFGWSLAMDGGALAVGEPYRASNAGRIHYFPSVTRHLAGTLPSYDRAVDGTTAGAMLGQSVALAGNLLVAGAPHQPFSSLADTGAIRIFECHTTLNELAPDSSLLAPVSPRNGQLYGSSVAAAANRVVAGAPGDGGFGTANAGAAWQGGPVRPSINVKGIGGFRLGLAAPGVPGAQFAGFTQALTDDSGLPVVLGTIAGGGVSASTNKGLWYNSASGIMAGPRTGDVSAGFTTTSIYGLLPGSASGRFSGYMQYRGARGALTTGLFDYDGTQVFFTLRTGDEVVPNTAVATIGQAKSSPGIVSPAPFTLKLGGTVNAANDSAINNPSGTLLREGDPSSFGAAFGQLTRLSAAPGGKLIFACPLQAPLASNAGLQFTPVGGASTPVARKADPAPGFGGASTVGFYNSFLGEAVASTGTYAFRASLNLGGTVTADNNEGLWADNAAGGLLQLNARKGDPFPNAHGLRVRQILKFGVNSAGRILFLAQVSGTGVTAANDQVLAISDSNNLEILLREGDYAPGTLRGKIGSIQSLDMDPVTSRYAVLVSLVQETEGVSTGSNQMLLAGNFAFGRAPALWQPVPVMTKGQRFARTGSDVVKSLSFPGLQQDATGSMATGLGQVIASDQVIYQAEFGPADKLMMASPLSVP